MTVQLKQWPENNGLVSFEDLVRPIVNAIRYSHRVARRRKDKDIPYVGYERVSCLHVCLELEVALSAKNLAYSEDEQGRDCLTQLVSIAVQLGMEQGERQVKEELQKILTMLKILEGIPSSDADKSSLEFVNSMLKTIVGVNE